MAGNSRFDISSSNPDGSNFTGYSNGPRSHFLSASNLERSSSFRDLESRNLMAGPNLPRGGASSHGEHLPLSQVLLLDTLSMGDQKFTRQVELRRVINAAVGSQAEDPSLGTVHAKALASLGPEELKRVRSFVAENSQKARERVKFLNEAICKLDKFRVPLSSRKMSRTEISTPSTLSVDRSAVGGNLLKVGSQSHTASNSVDTSSQRSDDRKSAVPNKRVRTSMDTRLEGRPNNLSRPSIMTDRERDLFRPGNAASQSEDKDRTLPSGSEGWEKTKLKGRRSGIKSDVSLSTVANRTLDSERDHKRGIQQRPNIDNRSRPSEGHGYRSGPVHGVVSTHKLENPPQLSGGLNVRSITRNEHESTTINEKRDRFIGSEKDRTVLKSSIKPNIRDENHAASPTTITKGKASRAPRSSSGAVANSSPHFPRTSPTFDGWERSSNANRVQVPSGTNNRKRPLPTRSSSPPVAQWVGQRPPKMSRVRRTNLAPPVSNRDDVTSLAEGSPNPESGAKPDSTESNGAGFPRRSSNNSVPQQSKLKTENVSSAGLSESEESGAVDNKCKDKNKKQGDAEEKVVPVSQKVGSLVLPSKKTKIVTKEESGDGVRRQGRSGRGLAPFRANIPPPSGKLENSATAKQLRSTRPGTDKVESKTGRPPTKKISSDRKPHTRPRRPLNSGSSDFTGESDDDREELLAAANAAINASETACSGPFWKQMEPFFAFLTQDDLDFLKQQIRQVEDADATAIYPFGNHQNGKAGIICNSLPASPTPIITSKQRSFPNGSVDNEALRLGSLNDTKDMERSSRKRRWLDKMLPLSQRVLSALIIEEDLSRILYDGQQDDSVQCISEDSPCGTSQIDSDTKDTKRVESEIELEVELKKRKRYMLDGSRYDSHTASNGHWNYTVGNSNGDELRQEDDIVECSEIETFNSDYGQLDERHMHGRQKNNDESQSNYQTIGLISGIATYEMQSEEMFLDQRILLELHTLGLFPEFVPDLSQREDEEIKEDICKLQEQLQQQVSRNKSQVYKLEKAVLKRQEIEEREREILAFNKLLDIAYSKHMGCRGANASGGKSAGNKVAKQAALAFVKRTLDKCQKFDETGKSCFSEASLKERLFCTSSRETDTKPLNEVIEGDTANVFAGSTPSLSDLKPSAVSVTASENTTHVIAHVLKTENGDGGLCDTLQAIAPYSEQAGVKDELWSTRGKKRELPLEEVVGSGIIRGAPALEATLVGGTKGKRSERDREGKGQNKEILTRSGTAKSGRPGLGNAKGERKNKPKPRQKTAQLSATVNGLLGKPAEAPKLPVSDSGEKSSDKLGKLKNDHNPGATQDTSHDNEGAIDLSHLQLPGMEDFVVTDDLGGQGQDLGSWLNFEDEALQDGAGDFMGLDVPMDDLSDLAMMV